MEQKRSASAILEEQNTKTKEENKATIDRLHKIKEIGKCTKKFFESGKIDEFGEILHEHWIVKKGLSNKICNPFIDEVYETARKNGALGGKVIGAGGGGFLLLYCPTQKTRLVSAMKKINLKELKYDFDFEGTKVLANFMNYQQNNH